MRQLVYTMYISNNRPRFHLWWNENLIKHQKVSKYYESDCRLSLVSEPYFRFVYFALVVRKFIRQTKSAVIPRYEKCFILHVICSHPRVQDIFYFMLKEIFLFYGLISSHPEMWREHFLEKKFFQNVFFFLIFGKCRKFFKESEELS